MLVSSEVGILNNSLNGYTQNVLISRKGNLPLKLKALALQISFQQFLIIHAVGFEEWVF